MGIEQDEGGFHDEEITICVMGVPEPLKAATL